MSESAAMWVKIAEIEKPVPKDNETLLKVHASTVNRTDCGFRSAEYFISRFWSGFFKPKYKTLGCEFAGQIEAVGKHVASWTVGDKIFGFNDQKFGGHAGCPKVKLFCNSFQLKNIP